MDGSPALLHFLHSIVALPQRNILKHCQLNALCVGSTVGNCNLVPLSRGENGCLLPDNFKCEFYFGFNSSTLAPLRHSSPHLFQDPAVDDLLRQWRLRFEFHCCYEPRQDGKPSSDLTIKCVLSDNLVRFSQAFYVSTTEKIKYRPGVLKRIALKLDTLVKETPHPVLQLFKQDVLDNNATRDSSSWRRFRDKLSTLIESSLEGSRNSSDDQSGFSSTHVVDAYPTHDHAPLLPGAAQPEDSNWIDDVLADHNDPLVLAPGFATWSAGDLATTNWDVETASLEPLVSASPHDTVSPMLHHECSQDTSSRVSQDGTPCASHGTSPHANYDTDSRAQHDTNPRTQCDTNPHTPYDTNPHTQYDTNPHTQYDTTSPTYSVSSNISTASSSASSLTSHGDPHGFRQRRVHGMRPTHSAPPNATMTQRNPRPLYQGTVCNWLPKEIPSQVLNPGDVVALLRSTWCVVLYSGHVDPLDVECVMVVCNPRTFPQHARHLAEQASVPQLHHDDGYETQCLCAITGVVPVNIQGYSQRMGKTGCQTRPLFVVNRGSHGKASFLGKGERVEDHQVLGMIKHESFSVSSRETYRLSDSQVLVWVNSPHSGRVVGSHTAALRKRPRTCTPTSGDDRAYPFPKHDPNQTILPGDVVAWMKSSGKVQLYSGALACSDILCLMVCTTYPDNPGAFRYAHRTDYAVCAVIGLAPTNLVCPASAGLHGYGDPGHVGKAALQDAGDQALYLGVVRNTSMKRDREDYQVGPSQSLLFVNVSPGQLLHAVDPTALIKKHVHEALAIERKITSRHLNKAASSIFLFVVLGFLATFAYVHNITSRITHDLETGTAQFGPGRLTLADVAGRPGYLPHLQHGLRNVYNGYRVDDFAVSDDPSELTNLDLVQNAVQLFLVRDGPSPTSNPDTTPGLPVSRHSDDLGIHRPLSLRPPVSTLSMYQVHPEYGAYLSVQWPQSSPNAESGDGGSRPNGGVHLWDLVSNQQTRILVEGEAGSGKSTLLKFIAQSWAASLVNSTTGNTTASMVQPIKSLETFDLVVWIPLRNIARLEVINPSTILPFVNVFGLFDDQELASLNQDIRHGAVKVLWMFDSVDEATSAAGVTGAFLSFVNQLIGVDSSGISLLSDWLTHYIVTSRPGHFPSAKQLLRNSGSVGVEKLRLVGFQDRVARDQYIDMFFRNLSPKVATSVKQFFVNKLELLNRNPLYVQMVCYFHAQKFKNSKMITSSMDSTFRTQIYESVLTKLIPQRALRGKTLRDFRVTVRRKIQASFAEGATFLASLKSSRIFTEEQVEEAIKVGLGRQAVKFTSSNRIRDISAVTAAFKGSGILSYTFLNEVEGNQYFFSHETFREFFVGRAMHKYTLEQLIFKNGETLKLSPFHGPVVHVSSSLAQRSLRHGGGGRLVSTHKLPSIPLVEAPVLTKAFHFRTWFKSLVSTLSFFVDLVLLDNSLDDTDRTACLSYVFVPIQQVLHQCQQDVVNEVDFSPLHWAAENGYVAVVHVLVENGHADVNLLDYRDTTPLHVAALNGHLSTVKYLLRAGAHTDGRTTQTTTTPLHLASSNGHVDVAKVLLAHGAWADATDADGATPLYWAVVSGQHEVAAILIKSYGADVNVAETLRGFTPLHRVVQNGDLAAALLLLEAGGANVDAEDFDGHSPLHLAAVQGDVAAAKLLLDWHADAAHVSAFGYLPIYLAALEGGVEMVEFLLPQYVELATPEQQSELSESKLHRDGESSSAVATGDDVRLGGGKGHGQPVQDDYELQSHTFTVMRAATKGNRLSVMEMLAQRMPADLFAWEVNRPDPNGNRPLFYAARNGNIMTLRFLLQHGATITVNDRADAAGLMGPLDVAVQTNHLAVVEMLIDQLEKTTTWSDKVDLLDSAFIYSARSGHLNIMRYLGNSTEVDVNSRDDTGLCALSWAVVNGYTDVVEYLVALPQIHISQEVINLAKLRGKESLLVQAKVASTRAESGPGNQTQTRQRVLSYSRLVQDHVPRAMQVWGVLCSGTTLLLLVLFSVRKRGGRGN